MRPGIRNRFGILIDRRVAWRALCVLALVLPAVYAFRIILQASHFPEYDYWHWLSRMFRPNNTGELTDFSTWIALENEHSLAVVKSICLLNIVLFGGSNRYLCLWSLPLAALQTILLVKALPTIIRRSKSAFLLSLLVISCLTFTPQARDSWMRAQNLVPWFIAHAIALTVLSCARVYLARRTTLWFSLTISSTVLAPAAFGTGLMVPPLVCLSLFLGRAPRGRVASLLVSWAVSWLLYFSLYDKPPHHPDISLDLVVLAEFVFGLLGGAWLTTPAAAKLVGALGALSFVFLWLRMLKWPGIREEACLSFWLITGLYSLANRGLIALARAGFGVEYGITASRYATLPAIFWISLAVSLLYYVEKTIGVSYYRIVLAVVALFFIALSHYTADYGMWRRFVGKPLDYIQFQRNKDLASISLRIDRPDRKRLSEAGSPSAQVLIQRTPLLKKLGHYPFNNQFQFDCGLLDQIVDEERIVASGEARSGVRGTLAFIGPVRPGLAEVSGWAHSRYRGIECLVIINQQRRVVGAAVLGFPRPDVKRILKIRELHTGWRGYVRLNDDSHAYAALVKLDRDDRFFTLRMSFRDHPASLEGL